MRIPYDLEPGIDLESGQGAFLLRPIVRVKVHGPDGHVLDEALADTGADWTVFTMWFEGRTGLLLRTRLRPGLDRSATCVEEELDQLLPPLRRRFPRTPILLRGDAGMATPAVEAILEGYGETLEVLRPYLCADPQQITQESYHTIERLAAQSAADSEARAAAAGN